MRCTGGRFERRSAVTPAGPWSAIDAVVTLAEGSVVVGPVAVAGLDTWSIPSIPRAGSCLRDPQRATFPMTISPAYRGEAEHRSMRRPIRPSSPPSPSGCSDLPRPRLPASRGLGVDRAEIPEGPRGAPRPSLGRSGIVGWRRIAGRRVGPVNELVARARTAINLSRADHREVGWRNPSHSGSREQSRCTWINR